MVSTRGKFLFSVLFSLFILAANLCAQSGVARPQLTTPTPTPTPPEQTERIATEEIKLNISAFDTNGIFVGDVRPEDLVVSENGRLHQPTSVRKTPANVLLLLDVGGEIAYAKRRKTTAAAAQGLVSALHPNDSVAVMQYADKVEVLSGWTNDKAKILQALNDKKLGYGKRSVFNSALDAAVAFFRQTSSENRHLILITDGVDSLDNTEAKRAATRNLLSSDINVHVLSYTQLQQRAITIPKTLSGGGTRPRTELPPGAEPPVRGTTPTFPVATINLDREMIRKREAQLEELKNSERFLTTIAQDTNGEIFLPETDEEMIAKTTQLAKNIDSQYVVTYIPKNPLDEARDGEVRLIEVTSKRANLDVQGRRKLVVVNDRD